MTTEDNMLWVFTTELYSRAGCGHLCVSFIECCICVTDEDASYAKQIPCGLCAWRANEYFANRRRSFAKDGAVI